MKHAFLAILTALTVGCLAAQAGDRLSQFSVTPFSESDDASFVTSDLTATPCIRYRRKTDKPISFLLEVSPWGILSSPDVDGFYTSGPVGSRIMTETLDGTGSWIPTVHAGFGVNTAIMDFDFLFGAGYMGNEVFGSGFYEMIFNPRFRLGPHVRFGPFVSLMAVGDAEWYDESDIELEGGAGARAGLSLAVGGQKVFFNLAVSYLEFEYDVNTRDGLWTASSDKLDMSGGVVQMGVYCRF